MRYSIAETVSDYGFSFYEKLHEPIFMVNRLGKIVRVNEAGRKLLKIGHLVNQDLENNLCVQFRDQIEKIKNSSFLRMNLPSLHLQLIAQNIKNSDFFLVEVKRFYDR